MTGIPAVPLPPTAAADQLQPSLLVLPHSRHRQDSGGDGNDPEAKHHHHRGQQPPQLRLRHHVSVANCGHGDDRPVNAARHRLELGVRPCALDHKFALIDNRKVITGSFNCSPLATHTNDEAVLVIH